MGQLRAGFRLKGSCLLVTAEFGFKVVGEIYHRNIFLYLEFVSYYFLFDFLLMKKYV